MNEETMKKLFPAERDAVEQGLCPFCGKPVKIEDFTEGTLEIKEFELSGMCQTCQSDFFRDPEA